MATGVHPAGAPVATGVDGAVAAGAAKKFRDGPVAKSVGEIQKFKDLFGQNDLWWQTD